MGSTQCSLSGSVSCLSASRSSRRRAAANTRSSSVVSTVASTAFFGLPQPRSSTWIPAPSTAARGRGVVAHDADDPLQCLSRVLLGQFLDIGDDFLARRRCARRILVLALGIPHLSGSDAGRSLSATHFSFPIRLPIYLRRPATTSSPIGERLMLAEGVGHIKNERCKTNETAELGATAGSELL